MRIKFLPSVAAIAAAAALAGVLPVQQNGTKQDTTTQVSQARDIQPQYATTADTSIHLKANITQEQIDQARERVKAAKDGKAPEPPRPGGKASERKVKDSKPLPLDTAYDLANGANQQAKEHPYKGFGKASETATTGSGDKITMSPTATYDLNESTVCYPVGTTPPTALENMCFGGSENFDVVIDRFSSCSRATITVDYYKISTNQPPEHVGRTTGKMRFFQQQYNTARSMRIFAKMEPDSVDYQWGWYDDVWTAPGIDLTVVGNCYGTGGCSASQPPITLTWENWNSIDTWYYWNINSDATQGYGRDKQLAHQSHVQIYTDTGEYQTINKASVVKRIIRCDSAYYIYSTWGEGCVFLETIPRMMYSRAWDSPHLAVAEHIYTTQNTPDSTYPTSTTPKRFPGEWLMDYNAPGLHRIHPDFHQDKLTANTRHKDNACASTGDYSTTGLPPELQTDTANGEECDEYPFRTTLEGAANPDWDFSVRAVNGKQNGSAGQTLMIYMRNHRILAWDATLPAEHNDRFYVQIVDW